MAIHVGVPPAVARPMIAAYSFPRLVRSGGLGGEARVLVRGLAQGCPAATDWMALMMHGWRARVSQLVPVVRTRGDVDDLEAYIEGGAERRVVAVQERSPRPELWRRHKRSAGAPQMRAGRRETSRWLEDRPQGRS